MYLIYRGRLEGRGLEGVRGDLRRGRSVEEGWVHIIGAESHAESHKD